MIRRDILPEDGWFAKADEVLVYVMYMLGTTDEQIALDPDANRLDLTGFELQFELHHSRYHNRVPILTKVDADITTDPLEGLAYVTIASDDLATLDEGWYFHTLWKMNTGDTYPLSYGRAFIRNPAWTLVP